MQDQEQQYFAAADKIILALDIHGAQAAKKCVRQVEGHIRFFKVGLALFLSSGMEIVDWLVKRNCRVMVDLKFFDIPNTVKQAVAAFTDRGVDYLTVHAEDQVMEAASSVKKDIRILGVTFLTSLGSDGARKMGFSSVEEIVCARAIRAMETGCDGVVCSGAEAGLVRKKTRPDFHIITPGIRLQGANVEKEDQNRVMTPGRAISGGADKIVVGRPVLEAKDPVSVIMKMIHEIAQGDGS